MIGKALRVPESFKALAGGRSMIFVRSIVLLSTLLMAGPVSAQITWDWSYSSDLYTGSGTFVTQSSPSTSSDYTGYQATNMTGIWDGQQISGLLTAGSLAGNDNLIGASQPQLDGAGIAFASPVDQFNIYYTGDGYQAFGNVSAADSGMGSFSATQEAPFEPSDTVAIIGIAVLGIRQRQQYRVKTKYRKAIAPAGTPGSSPI